MTLTCLEIEKYHTRDMVRICTLQFYRNSKGNPIGHREQIDCVPNKYKLIAMRYLFVEHFSNVFFPRDVLGMRTHQVNRFYKYCNALPF